jgi:hypothetical protein
VRRAIRSHTAPTVAALFVVLLLFAATSLAWHTSSIPTARVSVATEAASTAPAAPTASDSFVPDLGVPATDVVAFGVSPGESPDAAWAYGKLNDSEAYTLFEHLPSGAWRALPLTPEGTSLGAIELGALGAQATFSGGVVAIAEAGIAVRNPGGPLQLAPAPEAMQGKEGEMEKGKSEGKAGESEVGKSTAGGGEDSPKETKGSPKPASPAPQGVLGSGESVPPSGAPAGASTPYAAVEEEGSEATGVLIAPYHDGLGAPGPAILHYDGSRWTREPIAIPSSSSSSSPSPAPTDPGLTPEAVTCGGTAANPAASSPEGCWLLAAYEAEAGTGKLNRLALFRRMASSDPSGYTWRQVQIADPSGLLGTPTGGAGQTIAAPLDAQAQMLTATSSGLWIDFQAKVGEAESQVSELAIPAEPGSATGTPPAARAVGTWCFHPSPGATGTACEQTLAQGLPNQYRSFAWPGGTPEDPGTRIITGFPRRGMLELTGGSFSYVSNVPAGTVEGAVPGGAAFISPQQGWIADGADRGASGAEYAEGSDGAGQSQVIELTTDPRGDQLQEESVPFRHPLLALAQAPGTTPGDSSAEAVAVGVAGQIGHYVPGEGWISESLYNSAGEAQTEHTLRGVAWPEPDHIYAVGDNGTMWLWRAETGLWEPDPAKPFNFIGNLTAIAFCAGRPELGYAVGKQGVLLKYGKSWEQISTGEAQKLEQELHVEMQDLDFTSITFAGEEALATYRLVQGEGEVGGILVDERGSVEEGGSGWHVEHNLPQIGASVLSKIAGLPDGGVVAAGPAEVIERDGAPGSTWRFSSEPPPLAKNVSALAAYREAGGAVRAVISVDLDQLLNPNDDTPPPFRFSSWGLLDAPPPSGPDQPPFFVEPDPLPDSGYLLKETADGWVDLEHAALPAVTGSVVDQPLRPDPVLALLVNQSGTAGLAVGGQTGDYEAAAHLARTNAFAQTGAAMRFPAAAASANGSTPTALVSAQGQTSFVVGGQAACLSVCLADEGFGPEAWLTQALHTASRIDEDSAGRLRAFLYTGSIGGVDDLKQKLGEDPEPLLPVYASGASSTCPEAQLYCRYQLPGSPSSGPVTVIMLSYAGGALETGEPEKLKAWLEEARSEQIPAIVVGNAALGFKLPETLSIYSPEVQEATDAAAVAEILKQGEASAYFFDYPGNNVVTHIPGSEIPAYGSGTIGYVSPPVYNQDDLLGSSGFLLASVDPSRRGPSCPAGSTPNTCNAAQVTVHIVPNISQLSMNATNGTILHRSQVALFEALARRPPGGIAISEAQSSDRRLLAPDPYDQIPFDCQGPNCPYALPTEYTFTSSEPDKGAFVVHEPGSAELRQVELGPNKLPVLDEPRNSRGELTPDGQFERNAKGEPINEKGEVVPADQSGIFCAFNATGSRPLMVSIATGGLTYSEPITIRAGSVEYPCGTVPLKNPPPAESTQLTGFPNLPLASSNPPQANPQVQTLAPQPPPTPAAAAPQPHPHVQPAALPPFIPLAAPAVPRPIPPSGTSPVYQSAVAPEDEREEETATSLVGLHEFSAYRPEEHSGSTLGPGLLLLMIVAAGAGTGIHRGRRSSRQRQLALARANSRGR